VVTNSGYLELYERLVEVRYVPLLGRRRDVDRSTRPIWGPSSAHGADHGIGRFFQEEGDN
jgi:hypothetical protein